VLSGAESVWEAVWNTEGRCSGMNVSRYFTFLASTYNLFNANVSLLVVMWWVSFGDCVGLGGGVGCLTGA
jgi:hypothetical protein